MCDYCEKEKELLVLDDLINHSAWVYGWDKHLSLTLDEAINKYDYKLSVFIDRGNIRIVDPEDSQCLDHGQKIKIKFCPFCGNKLK